MASGKITFDRLMEYTVTVENFDGTEDEMCTVAERVFYDMLSGDGTLGQDVVVDGATFSITDESEANLEVSSVDEFDEDED